MPHTIYLGARSLFVTVTAWTFIALGLLASASALLQHAQLASLPAGLHAHPMLPWVLLAGLVMSLATVASAVGLLLRLDWARRAFIGVLVVAIVANLAGLWLQHALVQSLVDATLMQATVPPQVLGVFGGFVTAAQVMGVLVTLGACGVLAWIIGALMSPGVRQEFA